MENISEAVSRRVIEAIVRVKRIPVEAVTVDSRFQDLGMDSLDGLNLFFELEEMFDISISDELARSMRSVRDVVDEITRILASGHLATNDQAGA